MEGNQENMALNIAEKQAVEKYQKEIKDVLAALGSMRRQFNNSEEKLFSRVDTLESELMNYLRVLAKNRGMTDEEDWIFDQNSFSFVKKPQ